MYGLHTSILVAPMVAAAATAIGVAIGVAAGYAGGWVGKPHPRASASSGAAG